MASDIIIKLISEEINIKESQVSKVLNLLEEGATIPFISRYRKEATGNLDEVVIQTIEQRSDELLEISKRKEYIISVIEENNKLTEELKQKIDNCWDKNQIEDIYLPYKPKRKTRAEIARSNGLEPLAKIIMSQHDNDVSYISRKFINENVTDSDDAIKGACDIISEWVSENEFARNAVRRLFRYNALISCKVVKGKEEEGENYKNYFDFSEPLKRASSHRILAIRRGEKEGILKVSITIDELEALKVLNKIFVKNNSESSQLVEYAIKDSYKRLIKPSIENEFDSISKEKADKEAIDMFAQNLRQLLFAPPLGQKRVMGVDPGFRTGCKIVCLDAQGNLLHNDVIYPNAPQNDYKLSAKKITQLVEAYKIDAVAIGNGTASRETERFFSNLHYDHKIQLIVVSENGASIYSASKIAREEFPDKDVTVRGAVSIGRRLLDPLAELIKIDPKSIGVGQYQHDVDQAQLKKSLDFVVESCVNSVGVNLNTASQALLTHISGLGPQLAKNIIEYRANNGDFKERKDLLKVPRMGAYAFQQSAGFLRIPNGYNILDNTAVHPERYAIVEKIAKDKGLSLQELISDSIIRNSIKIEDYVSDEIGMLTLQDIMNELDKLGRDPRSKIEILEFDSNIRKLEDIKIGMILKGIVTNITQFGAFVDVGIKENGLIHISQMCNEYISSPSEVLKLHQHVSVKVIDIDITRKRLSLSLKDV